MPTMAGSGKPPAADAMRQRSAGLVAAATVAVVVKVAEAAEVGLLAEVKLPAVVAVLPNAQPTAFLGMALVVAIPAMNASSNLSKN